MVRVGIAALTRMGSHVYTELKMNEGYTMNQLVVEVKRQGFIAFRILDTMKTYVYIWVEHFGSVVEWKNAFI